MLPMYFVFGFGQGFQPVAGYNFGAGNKQRVKDSFRYAVIVSLSVVAVSCVFFLLFGNVVFTIYNSSESVTSYGLVGIKYYAIGLLFMGVSNTIGVFYQSLGRGVEALILSVARQGIFFIPLILILPGIYGVEGVLVSQAVADLLTAILSIAIILPFFINKKLDVLMTH